MWNLNLGELNRVQAIHDVRVDVDQPETGRCSHDMGSVACLCLVLSLFFIVFGVAMMSLAYTLQRSPNHVSLLGAYGFRMDTVGIILSLVGLSCLFLGLGLIWSGACLQRTHLSMSD